MKFHNVEQNYSVQNKSRRDAKCIVTIQNEKFHSSSAKLTLFSVDALLKTKWRLTRTRNAHKVCHT